MALTELTANLNVHQSNPDKPAMTATQLKQNFDSASNLIKSYVNETLTKEIDTLVANLQSGVTTTSQAVTQLSNTVTGLATTIAGYKSGATTKITIGSSVPSSLENGEVYLQYFS